MFMSIISSILVAFAALFIAVLMINIRHIFTGKEFRGTCAQNNPMLKNQIGECSVCGRKPEEECKMPEVNTSL